jgi:transmembrane sensor
MTTKEEQAKALLKKYAEGRANTRETEKVENWYADYEDKDPVIPESRKAEIGNEIYFSLQRAMDTGATPKVQRLSPWLKPIKVAAVFALISGSAVLLWSTNKKDVPAEIVVAISTSATQKKHIVLVDGSDITLGPLAKLVYPLKFKATSRWVKLSEGEAFFKIEHDEQRPFTVETAEGLYTKVLGTSFNIKSYAASKKTSIVVLTGKVAIGNANQVFGTLIKGQQLTYDKQNLRAVIDYTPKPVYTNMVFEGETLSEVCTRLNYAYSIHIKLAGATLNNLKCTATFNTKQSPEEIIALLCSLHHLKMDRSDDHKTFNLYKK